jgi:hypothetical protein
MSPPSGFEGAVGACLYRRNEQTTERRWNVSSSATATFSIATVRQLAAVRLEPEVHSVRMKSRCLDGGTSQV